MVGYGFRVAALCLFGAGAALAQETGGLTVEGRGSVAAAPDMAELRIGVETRADSAEAAVKAMSAEMSAVTDALSEAGIAAADLRTGELSLGPVYGAPPEEGGASPVEGYTATNVVTATLRDLSRLGAVIGAGVEGGATRLDGLAFALSDPAPVSDAALAAAMADALRKARLLAAAGDLTLGDIVAVEEGRGGGAPGAMRAMAADVPVSPGTLSQEARLTVTFAIGE